MLALWPGFPSPTPRPTIAFERQALDLRELWSLRRTLARSSVIGTLVGIVPAAGPNIAAFLGYSEARRASKSPEAFGTGLPEGVAAPEAANNAVPAGAPRSRTAPRSWKERGSGFSRCEETQSTEAKAG